MSDAGHDGALEAGAVTGHGPGMAAFPRPEARSLTGRRYVLPDDFAGNFTIVLLAFEMLADWSDSDYNVNPYLPTTAARLNRFNVNR